MTVKRFDCTNGGMHYCAGCYTMEEDTDGEYVRPEYPPSGSPKESGNG